MKIKFHFLGVLRLFCEKLIKYVKIVMPKNIPLIVSAHFQVFCLVVTKVLTQMFFYALRAFGISSRISTLEHKYKVQHKMRCFPNFVLRFWKGPDYTSEKKCSLKKRCQWSPLVQFSGSLWGKFREKNCIAATGWPSKFGIPNIIPKASEASFSWLKITSWVKSVRWKLAWTPSHRIAQLSRAVAKLRGGE